jgi:hypothetical protein
MGDYLPELAPYDWLAPRVLVTLTAANADLLARNQVLQESLLASETEVTRLQDIIHDHNRTWFNMDCEMHDMNLANQANLKHWQAV